MLNHKVQATAIKNTIDASQRFLLIGHKKPDADTLGSVCAWLHFLTARGKEVHAFCLDPVPEYLSHLPGNDRITQDHGVFGDQYDTIIINDSGSLEYAGVDRFIDGRDNSQTTLINIDHHSTNPHYGDLNLVISDASSTTEILFRLFTHWNEDVSKEVAESLLTGLITDTDSLTNPATSYHSMTTASQLIKAGANLHSTVKRVLKYKSVAQLKLWGKALSRLKFNSAYNTVATYLTTSDFEELSLSEESAEGIVNYLTLIPDVSVIMMLREHSDGTIKGSFRTVKDDIDVSALAALFGGGGHKKAAGFKIKGRLDTRENVWTIV